MTKYLVLSLLLISTTLNALYALALPSKAKYGYTLVMSEEAIQQDIIIGHNNFYYDDSQREMSKVVIKDGLFYDQNGNLITTTQTFNVYYKEI